MDRERTVSIWSRPCKFDCAWDEFRKETGFNEWWVFEIKPQLKCLTINIFKL
jgi:hypothetical protein